MESVLIPAVCVLDSILDILQLTAITSMNFENAKEDVVSLPENLQLKCTGRWETRVTYKQHEI